MSSTISRKTKRRTIHVPWTSNSILVLLLWMTLMFYSCINIADALIHEEDEFPINSNSDYNDNDNDNNSNDYRMHNDTTSTRRRYLLNDDDYFQASLKSNRNQKEQPPASLATVTVPLHASSGTHHVHVYVGSPPQRQTLIVDTGSRLMAFPCEPCQQCGNHASPYYHPGLSTTDKIPRCGSCLLKGVSKCSDFADKCIISQKYTEGSSWTAYETEDLVWLGSMDRDESIEEYMKLAVPYAFGCQTTEKGLFRKQYADGILGLAIHPTSLIRSLYEAKSISREAFSLCLTRTGGSLSVGGVANKKYHHLEEMSFSPIARDHGWFALHVWDVRVGEISVASGSNSTALRAFHGGKGTILDSGTTDTYLPKAVASQFSKAWTASTGLSFKKRKKRFTWAEFLTLPDISFVFAGNVTLTMEPSSYMEGVPTTPDWHGTKELVNRVYLDEPEGAVLGANTMFGHDILFDTQGQRVGLARANCDMQTNERSFGA